MYQESILNEVPQCIHKDKYHLFSIIYETKILIYMYIYIYIHMYVYLWLCMFACISWKKQGAVGEDQSILTSWRKEKEERREEKKEEEEDE